MCSVAILAQGKPPPRNRTGLPNRSLVRGGGLATPGTVFGSKLCCPPGCLISGPGNPLTSEGGSAAPLVHRVQSPVRPSTMGWQWDSEDDGYGDSSWEWPSWGGQGQMRRGSPTRRQKRSPPPQSWGLWECGGCGNRQTGSQCKCCHQKWWDVPWTKIDDTCPSPGGKTRDHGPMKNKHLEKDALDILERLLGSLEDSDDAHAQVSALRDLLRSRASPQNNRSKLKSILDQIEFQKRKGRDIKARLKALEAEKDQLEMGLGEVESALKPLEEARNELCLIVGNAEADDTEESSSGTNTPGGTTSPGGRDTTLCKITPESLQQLIAEALQARKGKLAGERKRARGADNSGEGSHMCDDD